MSELSPAWAAFRAASNEHRRLLLLFKYGRSSRADINAARDRRDAARKALDVELREVEE